MTHVPPRVIEPLYALPLSAFTRERNAQATALTKAGRADEARAVTQLRRPTAQEAEVAAAAARKARRATR